MKAANENVVGQLDSNNDEESRNTEKTMENHNNLLDNTNNITTNKNTDNAINAESLTRPRKSLTTDEQAGAHRRTSVTFMQAADDPACHKPKLQRTPTPFHEICTGDCKLSSSSQEGDEGSIDRSDDGIDGGAKNKGECSGVKGVKEDYDGICMKSATNARGGNEHE